MAEMDRRCRECGIDHIPSDPPFEIEGRVLCWAEEDLCSFCQDQLHKALIRDAARYRFLRARPTSAAAIGAGGVFGGRVPDNVILGGEDLDRALDAEMGVEVPEGPTLEARLAECLAACIDETLLTVTPSDLSTPVELRLGAFRRDIAERAAELLDEAGR